ncbi:glycerol-3-phosphate dehydrogenase/oxidase [Alkalihalobacillus sp. 1P02AB]|uniref:glycerol-3-phosphate dehydrogenase/oxidase n=1 Tax=Alkalihalobacillus sp. 1P02AB TaxID=3132260 RepID=UPI0039A71990
MNFSYQNRTKILGSMEKKELDVLVIGGGITGAGILLDGQSRGLQMGLVEMDDFASGTSSRSTKLIHGGLRYLKQFEIKLVAEVGKERAIVYENAPHVTTPVKMMLPFYKGGTFGRLTTSFGLKVYDYLAQVKRIERRKMLSKKETITREPLLKQDGLNGSGVYVEYRTDDARLTLEIIKKAHELGAKAVNYVEAKHLIYKDKKIVGVKVEDLLSGKSKTIYAKYIVNATGPWADNLREQDRSKEGKYLHLTKGVHIVIDQKKLPINDAIYFDTPFKDGRMIFAIPRGQKTYIGTTDTDYFGDPKEVKMMREDSTYLIRAINGLFPKQKLKEEDIESSWAGLRPLIHEQGKGPSDISRKDELFLAKSGLITIAGGKLTGYRKMAEKTMAVIETRIQESENRTLPKSETAKVILSGGEVGGSAQFERFIEKNIPFGKEVGFSEEEARQIVEKYGSNCNLIFELAKAHFWELERTGLPLAVSSTLLYSLEHEMAICPSDYYVRRSSLLLFDIGLVKKTKNRTLNWLGRKLNWTNEQKRNYTRDLDRQMEIATSGIENDDY